MLVEEGKPRRQKKNR